jgi:hypothetical protein
LKLFDGLDGLIGLASGPATAKFCLLPRQVSLYAEPSGAGFGGRTISIAGEVLMQAAQIASAVAVSLAALIAHVPAQAQDNQKLFVEGDIVRGNTPLGATGPICVLTSQFKRGENVVFRIRVRNPQGKPLDTAGIKSIEVELADGRKLPTRYGGHPPRQPTDFFWTAAWMIPENYPTGSLGYSITATDMDGNTVKWEPLREFRSWPTVIAGTVEYVKQAQQ